MAIKLLKLSFLMTLLCFVFNSAEAQNKKVEPPKPIFKDKDGKLQYTPDSLGNRIPDFSFSGYMGGNQPIPKGPIKAFVSVIEDDATVKIQSAIDYVSRLPINENGIRGVVLLQKGIFHVSEYIKNKCFRSYTSWKWNGKWWYCYFSFWLRSHRSNKDLRKNDRKIDQELPISDKYVPVNSTQITVSNPSNFQIGDQILIHRPSPKNWITM
jgi:hypothetical protein